MSNFKSKADYLKWLAYGHSNGLFENTPGNTPVSIKGKHKVVGHTMALGGDIPGIKKNVSVPQDYLDSLTQLHYYADGGQIPYAQIGNITGDLVEGNNDISQNSNASENKAIAGGALKGAGAGATLGAQIGSVVPGVGTAVGTAAGALIGGTVGAIKSDKAYKSSVNAFGKSMQEKYAGQQHDQATMYAAYGAELPEMGMGGDPVEFNGNTHENGGIALGGNVEVEDGEVQVGNYVFSNRLINEETGKTFAAEAKKITAKYKEYENDGPSMRTQDKALEALKTKNDASRAAQQLKDEAMAIQMEGDHAAYGAMIQKDEQGGYIVDKSHKPLLMEAAKLKGMGYDSYVENIYACGGYLKKKMASGGIRDKDFIPGDPNAADGYYQDSNSIVMPTKGAKDLFQGDYGDLGKLNSRNISFPQDDYTTIPDYNKQPLDILNLPPMSAKDVFDGKHHTYNNDTLKSPQDGYTTYPGLDGSETVNSNGSTDVSKLDNAALLASSLPAIQNMINSQNKTNTTFNRLHLNDINLDQERSNLKSAIARARAAHEHNVRGTATSSGDALAALSAGNAGLSSQEASGIADINAAERNANTQIHNRQAEVNLGLSNEEMIARQQDAAMKASVNNMAVANLGENANTYLRDKKLDIKNQEYNTMIKSLMDSGEYTMIPDGKGGFQILHKASQINNTK